MTKRHFYPIGKPGIRWTDSDKLSWLRLQTVHRSYEKDVLEPLEQLVPELEIVEYGELRYEAGIYSLCAIKNRDWRNENPSFLVTGGVHGYETSGVLGALRVAQLKAPVYLNSVNFLIVPCVSPWGYETINRWNPDTIDPNRSFYRGSQSSEACQLTGLLDSIDVSFLAHFDLHESTDSDANEFWPARAARDGARVEYYEIPDGFFLVGVDSNPAPLFQNSIIDEVSRVTHIAAPDTDNRLLGEPIAQPGVINLPADEMHLCASITDAKYVTTTEVYPDSHRVTPEQCIAAQVAAVVAGIDFTIGELEIGRSPKRSVLNVADKRAS